MTDKKKQAPRQRILFEELEPRLLLSADISPLVVDALVDDLDPGPAALERSVTAVQESSENAASLRDARRQELVFVDTGIDGYQALVDDMLASAGDGRQLDVVLLDTGRDGIAQISEALAGYADLDAVHLISHGSAGEVALGGGALNFESLVANAGTIKAWGNALDAEADFLIYGCDLAASADGRSLVDALSRLTSADVAASDDLTGSAALGGDWELEYRTASIEADVALSRAVQADWASTLAITPNSSSSESMPGTTNDLTWSHTVTAGGNRILTVSIALERGQSTGVTYGGTPLTLVGRNTGTYSHTTEIWQLVAPAVGTANIVATFDGAREAFGGAQAFNGVHQADPTGTFVGDSTDSDTPLVNVASDTGEVVIDVLYVDFSTTVTEGTDQTGYFVENQGRTAAGSTEAGAATVEMSWTLGGADEWNMSAVSLKPAPGTGISSDLVMHLTFDDGAGGTADDATANNNDGTLNGSAVWTAGEIGGALRFDYTDGTDYVEVPNSATLENVQEGDFTLASWFRPDSTPPGSGSDSDANYGIVIKEGWHTGLYFTNDNRFSFDHVLAGNSAVAVLSADTFTPGQFYHVAGVLDRVAGTLELFVDGQSQGTTSFTPGASSREYGTETWKLGVANPPSGSFAWPADGAIDDARIYARALSAADVDELYRLSPGGASTVVTFQEGDNGYTGTLDTELDAGDTGNPRGGNGSIGVDLDSGGFETQGLIRFDNLFGSGPGQIPLGSTINSAELVLQVTNGSNAGATIALHRMLEFWDENATWDSQSGGITPALPEAEPVPDATVPTPGNTGTITITGLAGGVQAWADGATNYGWAIISDNTDGWDFLTSDAGTVSDRPMLQVNYTAPSNARLWLSTDSDVPSPGADGLAAWTQGQALEFGGPDLAHGAATDGDLAMAVDFDTFTQNASDVGAMHFVSRDLTVGSGVDTFDLKAGDVLVSFLQDETIDAAYTDSGLDELYADNDLLVFRPDAFNDYSSGTFYQLLENVVPDDLKGATLIETDTVIGGTPVAAGTFLIIEEASGTTSVDLFTPTGVGAGTTTGTTTPFIDLSNLGIDVNRLRGIEVIEKATTIGGYNLAEGAILATLNVDDNVSGVAGNNLLVDLNDVFVLNLTATGPGTTAGTAAMFLDGSLVGLDDNPSQENPYALALYNHSQLVVDTTSDVSDGDTSSISALIQNKGADGFISLREAIEAANATANGDGPDVIHFDIGSGPQTIAVGPGGLPTITDAVIIDATSQPGFAGTPLITLDGSGATSATAALYIRANDSTVRGFIVHSFPDEGLEIDGTTGAGHNNLIEGNWVGFDRLGIDRGNSDHGIMVTEGGTGNRIVDNYSAGNASSGIILRNGDSDDNIVTGNVVGIEAVGMTAMGNDAHGIEIVGDSSGNLIGGTNPGDGNTIANNALDGIHVGGTNAFGNTLVGNVIYANGELGIDLVGGTENAAGVTTNDSDDSDGGNNLLQNTPVLSKASTFGGTVTIAGIYKGAASTTLDLDFYASAAQDGSGHGEAERYLGRVQIGTDTSGFGRFEIFLAAPVAAGEYVTATATDPGGNTSEFSQNLQAVAGGYSLWLTTEEDVAPASGVAGLEAWTGGEALSFGEPTLALSPSTTDGTLGSLFNLDDFVVGNDARLDSLHYVGRDMTVGSNAVPLEAGDVLFSSVFPETLVNSDTSTLAITSRDVVIFRPDSLSNYAAGGTFIKLIDGADLSIETEGVTLVETATTVGTGGGATNLDAGDFLFTDRDNPHVIYRLQPGVLAGGGTNTGAISVLVDGSDIGINQNIHGVELVESDVTIGGRTLTAGQLLVSLYADDTVAGTPVDAHDIFILDVTTTGASTAATVDAFFVGDDVGLADWQESPWAVSLAPNQFNSSPTTSGIADFSVDEDTAFSTIDLNAIFDDAEDPDTALVYTIQSNTNGALFDSTPIDGAGILTLNYSADQNGAADITVRATDTGGLFVETTFTVTVDPVNDSPTVATNTGMTVDEGDTGTVITTAMLNEGDIDDAGAGVTYTVTATPSHGTLRLSGGALGVLGTFTQDDIDNNRVTYDHDGTENFTDSFAFDLADGGEDGATAVSDTFPITINPVNDNAPDITSDGGGATAAIGIDENTTAVTNVVATDADGTTPTYGFGGGADDGLFTINATTGELSFTSAPNFEIPADANGDNVYEVIVEARDGVNTTQQAISVTVGNVNEAPVLLNGGRAYWQFDDGVGDTAADALTGAHPGQLGSSAGADASDPTWSAGRFGDALDFDGANDYVEVADAPGIDISGSTFSASLWMNPDSGPNTEDMLFMKGDRTGDVNYYLSWKSSGAMTWAFKDSAGWHYLDMNVTLPATGEWNHVAIVFDRPTVTLYVNGEKHFYDNVSTGGSMDRDLTANNDPLWIGAGRSGGSLVSPGANSGPFDGQIDDLAIYDQALTDADIEALRVSGPPAAITTAFTIDENAASATVVGSVVATEPDAGDTLTYAITGGNIGDAFAIDNAGQITVNNPAALNFEVTPVFELTVAVNDLAGLRDTAAVTISLNDVNDAPAAADWFDNSWSSRKEVTIPAANVDGAGVYGFPVLVHLAADAQLAAAALANGDDIVFTAADGVTQLAHEIQSYNSVTGELVAWVRTDLSGSVDNTLYMYYGHGGAANQENVAGVWSEDFIGVYHLEDTPDGSAGDVSDSTGLNPGTTEGAMDAADSVAGQIGQGFDFDEVDDLIRINSSPSIDGLADEATFSLWIWWDQTADGAWQNIFTSSNRFPANDGFEWATQGDGDQFFYPDPTIPDGNYNLGPNPYTDQTWHHAAVTMDFDTRDVQIYVDGTPMTFTFEDVPEEWTELAGLADLIWGGDPAKPSAYFDGIMDEIRIASVARSQSWLQTEVSNQSSPNTFLTLGAEERRPLTVDENAANGTVVGNVYASDEDAGDSLTFNVIGGTGATAFEVLPGTGQIRVLDATQLDFETSPGFTLIVQVDDDGSPVESDTLTLTINLNDINESPTVATNTGVTVDEGDTGTVITTAMLNEGDPDDAGTGVTYTVTATPAHGTLRLSGAALGVLGTFTQDDIDNNRVTYDHDGTENFADSFDFDLADGGEDGAVKVAGTFSITITPVNDNDPVADDESFTVAEGGTATEADLDAGTSLLDGDTDADLPNDTLSVNTTPVSGPSHGSLTLNANGTFSYTHDGSENFSDSFSYEVLDADGGVTDTGTVTITITPVNDNDPVADDEAFTVAEGATATEADLDAGTSLLDGDTDVDLPNDTLTVNTTPVSGPSFGSLTLNANGTFSYTHDGSENFSDSFTYEVLDADGGVTDTGTVTITITPVNDNDPVADDESFTVAEGATATEADLDAGTSLLEGDTDVDLPNDTLTVNTTPVSGPSFGSLTLNANGTFSYTHDGSENFSDSFTYEVLDADGGVTDTGTVTITITPVNDNDPVADDEAFTVAEGATATEADLDAGTSLLDGDTDVDLPNDTLTVNTTPVSGPSFGSLTLNANGTFSYTHDGSENFSDSFTYEVLDADGGVTDTGTVTITITPVNDNDPVADDESFTVAEGATATEADLDAGTSLLDGDTDVDLPNDTLTVNTTPVSGPSFGSLTLNANGTFSYTHDGSENLSDSFTYEVLDADGGVTDTGTVTITITPVNDNDPVADDESFTVAEGATATEADLDAGTSLLDGDTDVDLPNDTLTVNTTPVSGPSHGALTLNANGTFSYTHDGTENFSDSFTYEVLDADGGVTDTGTVTITITPVNDNDPVADDESFTVAEGGTATESDLDVGTSLLDGDTDVDLPNDTLTVNTTPVSGPSHGSLTLNANGTFSYTHDGSENFSDSFTYELLDADGGVTDTGTVTITITPVNDNDPVADDESFTVAEGATATEADLDAGTSLLDGDTDVDLPNDTLTVNTTPVSGPSFGSLTLNANGTFSYTHDGSENFSDSFTYEVLDADGGVTDTGTVTITITPVNDNDPVADDESFTIAEGATATEADLDAGTSLLDGDTDVDLPNDTLTVNTTPVAGPSFGSLTLNANGTFSYTHDGSENFSDSFTYEVLDADGGVTDTGTVTITITPVNDNDPVADDESFTVAEGATATEADLDVGTSLLDGDTDADLPNDTLTVNTTPVSGPSFGSLTLNANGTFSYTHDGSENFSDSFTYEVLDADGGVTDTGTVTITITPVNDNDPVADDESFTVAEGATATEADLDAGTSLLDGDTDVDLPNDTLTVNTTPVSGPSFGSLTLNANGTFSYTHDGSENFSDSFTYEVLDADGGVTDIGMVTITITPVNDNDPVADDESFTVAEGATATEADLDAGTSLLDGDTDVDLPNDTLTVNTTAVSGPSFGSLTLNANGTFSYTHDGSENFSDSFSYEVLDADGGVTDTGTVTITITPVNDNDPVADDESFSVAEGATATEADLDAGTSLLDGDTDADLPNDTLTVNTTPVSGPSFGSLTLNANGTFSYTHDGSENFSDSFTYEVLDADGGVTDTGTVTITITPVNDNDPVADDESFTVAEGATATEADLDAGTSLLDGDTDVDLPNDTLTVNTTPIAGPSFGSLTLNANGTFSYTHDGSENFSDSFTYEVLDADGGVTDTGTVTITITPVNDNDPVADDESFTVTEGATATEADLDAGTSLLDGDTDVDLPNDTLTVNTTPVSGPSFGSLTLNANGTFSYTHDGSENFFDSFTYEVLDADGGVTDTGTVAITITPVNDNAPDIISDGGGPTAAIGINENTTAVTDVNATDADGTTPTYGFGGGVDDGFFTIDPVSGVLTFTAAPDFETALDDGGNNVYDVIVEARDGVNVTQQAIAVTVNNIVNENAPLISNATASVAEDAINTTAVYDVNDVNTGNDTDIDFETITYTITAGDTDSIFDIDGATGIITVDDNTNLDYESTQQYLLTVEASDGVNTDTAVITVDILPINDNDPVADDESFTVAEGATATEADLDAGTSLLDGDTDADLPNDTLTVNTTPVSGPSFGSLTLNANGTFSYTHDGSENFSDSFTYELLDADGGVTDTGTVTITITPVNDNDPVADDESFTVAEGATATEADLDAGTSLLDGDTDVDLPNDTLTVNTTPVSGPSFGSLTLNANGTFSYTHDGSENFTDSFTYEVLDADGGVTDTGTVTITITPVNDNDPVADDESFTVAEGATATQGDLDAGTSLLDGDTDVDLPNDTLTVNTTPVSGPSFGSLTLNANGTFSYTHDGSENFSDSFTYEVLDADGGVTDTGTVTITITPVNDNDPVADDESFSVAEGATATEADLDTGTSLLDGDTDVDLPNDTLTVNTTTASGPSFGSLTLNANGTFSYTHDGSENFTDSFTYEVLDADGGVTDTGTVTITITPVNDNDPVADDESFTVAEGATATEADLDAGTSLLDGDTDVDLPNDTLTVNTTPVSGPSFGSLTLNANGTFSYTHDGSENFSDSFTYEVLDADGGVTDTGTVTITITPVNDNDPVADDESFSVAEGGTATEADLDTGTSLLDGDTDVDLPNDTLTVNTTPVSGPSFGSLTLNANGTFSYTHDGSENFSDSFTYEVLDADGGVTDTGTVTITITPVNDNDPVADDESFTVVEGGTATEADLDVGTSLLDGDTDVDLPNDTLTVNTTPVSGPSFGSLTLNANGTFSYTHDGSENFSDSFTYEVLDTDGGATDTGTVTITITPVNDNDPVADDESFTVAEGATATEADLDAGTSLLDGDIDADLPNDTLTVNTTPVSGPSFGSLTLNANGTFSYTHDGSENFSDSFTYEVLDADGGVTDTGTVTITITPVNDNDPVADDESFTVGEGGTATEADLDAGASLLDGDTDVDLPNDTLTVNTTPVSGPSFGALNLNANGTFSYTHDGSENFSDSFTYEVLDADGGVTDTGTVTITITPVNDNAPDIISDGGGPNAAIAIDENTTAVTDVNATDADGTTPTYGFGGGVDDGFFTIDPVTGVLTFSAAPDFETALDNGGNNVYDVIVEARDGVNVTQQAIAVTVNNGNETPTVALAQTTFTLAEDADTSSRIKVADIVITDDGLGTNVTALAGADLALFEIDGTELFLAAGSALDFETNANLDVTVEVNDASLAPDPNDSDAVTIIVTDANDAPLLANQAFTIDEAVADNTDLGLTPATDQDAGDTLSYAITGGTGAALFAIDPATGALTVSDAATLGADEAGLYSLTLEVSDLSGATTTANVVINVTREEVIVFLGTDPQPGPGPEADSGAAAGQRGGRGAGGRPGGSGRSAGYPGR